ncbi:winged helix-turn-helix domain-containing protein [Streptomyces sp. AA1529]|uniref:winged helix-turn-helix domain-containing protein n=1 Tax=Streptomyces sp. AA1529 TaxID=1203257 RepID=UPI0002F01352|nr:winged helix-turn-helix domain-containing protein [Streptomyces sp. AA1529]
MGDDLGGRVDPGLPVYVYVQVADDIARRIDDGRLPPGARLPAERDLAEEYGIAYGTARRVVQELRDRGLAITLPGKGTYIQTPAPGSAGSTGS